MNVEVVRGVDALERLLPEWTRLFDDSETPNPFAHPIWLTTWAHHYVAPGQLYVLAVRRDGELVGVAPFHKASHRLRGVRTGLVRLQPLGRSARRELTELPQILAHPAHARRVLRAAVQHLATESSEWDWAELVVAAEQGWPEWEWLAEIQSDARLLPSGTHPAVVLPLPSTWAELRSGLKRNLKESIRRGANRLRRDGYSWQLHDWPEDETALRSALQDLVALHRARAALPGKTAHRDCFSDDRSLRFIEDVANRLAGTGTFLPVVLRLDGEAVAARLVLRAHGSLSFSVSGFDPAWWRYGVATTLMAETLRSAIERGDRVANLSVGPDNAKLRWSERLELHSEFVLVAPRARSRLAFQVWWQRRAADALRKARLNGGRAAASEARSD